MSILKASRSSILENGAPTFEFQCYKGVRQGDPLSPFLSIMGMEVLLSMISKLCSENMFEGFKAPHNGPLISYHLYVNDTILIGEWNDMNISVIKKIPWSFNIISGLNIN